MPSRGDAVSGYLPPFAPENGAKVYAANVKQTVITGAITSAGVTEAFEHGLSGTPAVVVVTPLYDEADVGAATTGIVIGESAVSAATSTNIYVSGNAADQLFKAFLML